VASHAELPPIETNVFRGRLFWLGREPLVEGARYQLRLGSLATQAGVHKVEQVFDIDDLTMRDVREVPRHGVADVILRTRQLIAVDEATQLPRTGRFALSDGHNIVAGGLIDMDGYPDQRSAVTVKSRNLHRVAHRIDAKARANRNGHRGGVLWFTGLSGAGKSTLAMAVEQELFSKGYHVYVLDGDNVRSGLNANLGFSPEDRAENIRRVGEVAALFADAGVIVITAFISPYRADRLRARQAAGSAFHEVHIDADVATCESRDPKGLYAKARSGEITEFTGISAPYEAPEHAELAVDTRQRSVYECVSHIVAYIEANFALARRD
jgi:bifunctional enzyme CysN/CysC